MPENDIASWIHRQLKRRDWSAADLSRGLDISSGRISEWLNGKRTPSSQSCIRLADVFDADPDYVLALAGHRESVDPLEGDDPKVGIIQLVKRVELTPERAAQLEAILRVMLDHDRLARQGRKPQ